LLGDQVGDADPFEDRRRHRKVTRTTPGRRLISIEPAIVARFSISFIGEAGDLRRAGDAVSGRIVQVRTRSDESDGPFSSISA